MGRHAEGHAGRRLHGALRRPRRVRAAGRPVQPVPGRADGRGDDVLDLLREREEQIAYLSPPYAPAIFLLRGVIPDHFGISTNTIIRGVIPYILLIMVALALFIAFPGIITWLPAKMVR
ncbi:MAG: hypothetical protein ACE147_16205 [Candidatus Methylomirabilales bacterium]